MKPKYLILITIILIVIILAGVYIRINYRKVGSEECGNVVLSGYLVADCIWQAYPFLPDYNSTLHSGRCNLDIWLSKNEPEPNPEVCGEDPLTSECFLEKVSPFDLGGLRGPPWEVYGHQKVTLIGKYEKIKVCHLLVKGSGEFKCNVEKVFVPCEMKIDEEQTIKEAKEEYQQIFNDPKSSYCEADEDCDIAYELGCCSCPVIFNKEYAEKIQQLTRPDCDPELNCASCLYWNNCQERECIKCVNNSCEIVFPKPGT